MRATQPAGALIPPASPGARPRGLELQIELVVPVEREGQEDVVRDLVKLLVQPGFARFLGLSPRTEDPEDSDGRVFNFDGIPVAGESDVAAGSVILEVFGIVE